MAFYQENRLFLASKSPRRHELLKNADIAFEQVDSLVDEISNAGSPEKLAVSNALLKWHHNDTPAKEWCLAADTAVCLEGELLGKPADCEHAKTMLANLSGKTHIVVTAYALGRSDQIPIVRASRAEVTISNLNEQWIDSYVSSGDPMDKAGAYGVQGDVAEKIIKIDGDFSTVMGLPIYAVVHDLIQLGAISER